MTGRATSTAKGPAEFRFPFRVSRHWRPITDWVKGGRTDIDKLALACGHDNNERIRQGWYAIMLQGVPHWVPPGVPPPHIEPNAAERKPQRNRVHHG